MFFFLSCTNEVKKKSEKEKQDSLKTKILTTQKTISELKKERLTNILGFVERYKIFNGSVFVRDEGKTLIEYHIGKENLSDRKSKKINSKSRYRICSLTKSFTAMAIMLLAERGKVKYNDDIRKYIHQLSEYEGITIEHLLTHTSGLPDYTEYFYSISENFKQYVRNKDVLNWLTEKFPRQKFRQGTKWEYSNTGYVLLSYIIENASGKSYHTFILDNIIKEIGSGQMFLPKYMHLDKIPNRVFGFKFDNETVDDDNFLNYVYGDGGMYMSLEDLKKWDIALEKYKLLPELSFSEALKPVQLSNRTTHHYGYGWNLDKKHPDEMYHFGTWLGFRTLIYRIPKTKSTIIILNNNQSPAFEILFKLIYQIIKKERYNKLLDELDEIPKK